MRVRPALTLAAVVGISLQIVAGAAARPHPEAWGATLKYLDTATSGCGPQKAAPGGICTQADTFTVTMSERGRQSYRIEVANVRATANYRFFAWILPDGMTLKRIVSTRDGDCGISNGMISCARKLVSPGCGCSQKDLVVDFTAVGRTPTRAKGGYWIYYGLVTPYLDVPPTFTDVSFCDIGQKSTPAHPCVK